MRRVYTRIVRLGDKCRVSMSIATGARTALGVLCLLFGGDWQYLFCISCWNRLRYRIIYCVSQNTKTVHFTAFILNRFPRLVLWGPFWEVWLHGQLITAGKHTWHQLAKAFFFFLFLKAHENTSFVTSVFVLKLCWWSRRLSQSLWWHLVFVRVAEASVIVAVSSWWLCLYRRIKGLS